ncbi:hypothetical protein AAMO2058_000408800 [Amorphochlora amoebiformis]|uniref:Uncharacterized protein n=1 Tax=Amorphochlora amoebiformis TaxID=1561963 RepID=A0A7S0H0A4_9EUKA|mmetsp:Transcript_24156/g.38039  ORF Transcript_24156/g.38039 Transcript_24156/m.38039 type:complete len:218 (+) Transcript_24156:35-688(+)
MMANPVVNGAALGLLLLSSVSASVSSRPVIRSTSRSFVGPLAFSRSISSRRGVRGHAGSNMFDLLKDLQKNMGGGGGGDGNILQQTQDFQKKSQEAVKKAKEKLASAQYDGYSSDETVRFIMNGNLEPVKCDITQQAMAQGPEKMSAALTEAYQDAFKESIQGMRSNMQSFSQDLAKQIPGGLAGLGGLGGLAKPPPGGPQGGKGGLPDDQDDFPKM